MEPWTHLDPRLITKRNVWGYITYSPSDQDRICAHWLKGGVTNKQITDFYVIGVGAFDRWKRSYRRRFPHLRRPDELPY